MSASSELAALVMSDAEELVNGRETPTKEHDSTSAADDALDRDVANFFALGLSLLDIEKLFENQGRRDLAGKAREAGERLMLMSSDSTVPIARQASLGLELVRGSPNSKGSPCASAESVMHAVAALRAEWDDPPERFRDPIMLTLMNEPMVLSTGHTFDKSTIYDANGRLRFERCPLTRETISETAYPLVYLKREIIEFKLKRLDAVLDAAAHCARDPMLQLLSFAKDLLDSLGAARYQERAAKYWSMRLQTCGESAERLLEALDELAADHAASVSVSEERSELVVAKLMDEQSKALVRLVGRLADDGQPMRAATMILTSVRRLSALKARASWVAGWVELVGRIVDNGGRTTEEDTLGPVRGEIRMDLFQSLGLLRPPRESELADDEVAQRYWSLRLELVNREDTGLVESHRLQVEELARMSKTCLRDADVSAVTVSGAGVDECNGTYVRDGLYSEAPLFKNGVWWLLKYRLPRNTYWYIAHKDKLSVDDGDLYRIQSDALLPPETSATPPPAEEGEEAAAETEGRRTWKLAKDGRFPLPVIARVRSSPSAGGSKLRALFEAHKERLAQAGADLSPLEAPRRGALARIGWRAGWEVDNVVFFPRPPHKDALVEQHRRPPFEREFGQEHDAISEWDDTTQAHVYGLRRVPDGVVRGGGEREGHEMQAGEALTSVKLYTMGRYLGFRICFGTSEGREICLEGVKADEYFAVTHERMEFVCDPESGDEIVGLFFTAAGRLSRVMVRQNRDGSLRWQTTVKDEEDMQIQMALALSLADQPAAALEDVSANEGGEGEGAAGGGGAAEGAGGEGGRAAGSQL